MKPSTLFHSKGHRFQGLRSDYPISSFCNYKEFDSTCFPATKVKESQLIIPEDKNQVESCKLDSKYSQPAPI